MAKVWVEGRLGYNSDNDRYGVDCHNEKGKFYQENKAKKKKNDIENFILTK
jgi:hypothetical protein